MESQEVEKNQNKKFYESISFWIFLITVLCGGIASAYQLFVVQPRDYKIDQLENKIAELNNNVLNSKPYQELNRKYINLNNNLDYFKEKSNKYDEIYKKYIEINAENSYLKSCNKKFPESESRTNKLESELNQYKGELQSYKNTIVEKNKYIRKLEINSSIMTKIEELQKSQAEEENNLNNLIGNIFMDSNKRSQQIIRLNNRIAMLQDQIKSLSASLN